jgi:four helix bundle protein
MRKSSAQNFQDLTVWQRSHEFVLAVYELSGRFPDRELYGLSSQLRRAAVSISANIAEGFKRRTKPDKVRFYNIAQASAEECRYYLILARDLEYGKTHALLSLLDETSKLLHEYIRQITISMK